jgi:hypothetical protein
MWGLAIYSYMPYSIHGYIFERTGIYGLVWWRRPSHAHYRHVVTRSNVHSRRGRKISCRTRTGGNHEAIGTITWPGWQHRNRMARGRWSGQLVWAELGSKQRHQKFVTGRPDGGSRSRTFRPLLRRRWRSNFWQKQQLLASRGAGSVRGAEVQPRWPALFWSSRVGARLPIPELQIWIIKMVCVALDLRSGPGAGSSLPQLFQCGPTQGTRCRNGRARRARCATKTARAVAANRMTVNASWWSARSLSHGALMCTCVRTAEAMPEEVCSFFFGWL